MEAIEKEWMRAEVVEDGCMAWLRSEEQSQYHDRPHLSAPLSQKNVGSWNSYKKFAMRKYLERFFALHYRAG